MSALAASLHLLTVAVMAGAVIWFGYRAGGRTGRTAALTAIFVIAWLAYSGLLAANGFAQRVDILPPGGAAVLAPILAVTVTLLIIFARPRMRDALVRLPSTALIAAQIFRVPVEIVLALLVDGGQLPALLSYHGTNFDILTGLTAPFAAWAAARGATRLVIIWNLLGLALVLNVAISGILASPEPLQVIRVDPSSIFMLSFPMIWLPGFLVPLAIALHGLSLLQIFRRVS